jgi:hypothetical protein
MHHDSSGHETPPSFWSSRYAIGLVVIGAVAAYLGPTMKPMPIARRASFPTLGQAANAG